RRSVRRREDLRDPDPCRRPGTGRRAGKRAAARRSPDPARGVLASPADPGRRVPVTHRPRRRGHRRGEAGTEGPARPREERRGMSTTVRQSSTRLAPSTVNARVTRAISHGFLLMKRNLVTLTRVPTVFVFELVQPVMFVLLFRFIYANQLSKLPPGLSYVEFLMPGIFVQNAIFGATTTAIGLAEDMKKGIVDRFRSLPMARSGVLAGRTTFDLAKNLILVLIVIVIGYLVGFRFDNGLLNAVGMI